MPRGGGAARCGNARGARIVVGSPWVDEAGLHNSVLLLEEGRIAAIRLKVELPNYGVFDELRVFKPGALPGPVGFRGVRVGMPFQVTRDKRIIGSVRVVDVREMIAGAYIQNLSSEKDRIKVGDHLRVDARQ